MKNEASKTRTLDIAFVVNADLLRRLAVILAETSQKREYTVKFSDGTSVHYHDIEDVIGQPNSKERSIVSFIAGPADEQARSAYVNLRKNASPSVEYTLNGTQRDVIYFADKLDDWVAAVRQWYSPFFSSSESTGLFQMPTLSGAGLVLVFAAFALPIYVWDRVSKLFFSDAAQKSDSWIPLLAVVAMWTAEYYVCQLFPRGTFAVGRGEKQHQLFTLVRNTVLVGFVLSVIAGVCANWITKHL